MIFNYLDLIAYYEKNQGYFDQTYHNLKVLRS